MAELKEILEQTQGQLAGFIARSDEERKTMGTVQKETQDNIVKLIKRIDELEVKMTRPPAGTERKTLDQVCLEEPSLQQLLREKRGTARVVLGPDQCRELWEKKTTITSSTVGFPTSGVMPEERGRYVEEARRPLRLRDVIPSRPTVVGQIYWPKANVAMTKASPVAQAGTKPENAMTFTVAYQLVETISTWIPAARQVLDDWAELRGILETALGYQVDKEEDLQILSGSGTSPALNGLTTQAQAWDLTLLTASDGYEYIDVIAGAIQQISEGDEIEPTFCLVHPGDLWKMRRTKDSTGRYILGDPNSPFPPTLWGLRILGTTAMPKGYFLVGNGTAVAAEIRDRMGLEVVISTEHASYFTSNLVAIRAEKRMALCVYRTNAFCYGAFTQSPA